MFQTCNAIIVAALWCASSAQAGMIGINVLLNQPASDAILADLESHGQVLDLIPEINVIILKAQASELPAIQALAYVVGANPDAKRFAAGAGDGLPVPDFADGANLWNLDAIKVTEFGGGRTVDYDGEGVYIAVIDSGLPHNWRAYFPEERIDTLHARSFGGGGGEHGTVSEQPNVWEHDTDGHGTGVVSVILGVNYSGPEQLPVLLNGVAPKMNIIPVNVFHSSLAWSSVITHALLYVTQLKVSGALGDAPLIVNFSLLGTDPDVVESAAIDYAIANGVVIVGAAGNEGEVGLQYSDMGGMLYPAAYPPVISAANAGWVGQLPPDDSSTIVWILRDVAENDASQFYIAFDSSREFPGQDLDVTAPGIFAPAALTINGQVDYAFFFGTSAACPHVAGVAALMLQKNPELTQTQIEAILEGTALPLAPGCRDITVPFLGPGNEPTWGDHSNVFFTDAIVCWEANATGHGLLQADAALAVTPMP